MPEVPFADVRWSSVCDGHPLLEFDRAEGWCCWCDHRRGVRCDDDSPIMRHQWQLPPHPLRFCCSLEDTVGVHPISVLSGWVESYLYRLCWREHIPMARNHDDAGLYDCVTYTICGYRIYADDESIDTVAKLHLSSPREYTLIRDVRDSFCISLVLCFESCKIDCPEDVLLINSFGRLNKGLNLILTCILFDTMALPSALQAQPILGGGNCTIATYPPSRCPGPDMGCCEYCICLLPTSEAISI